MATVTLKAKVREGTGKNVMRRLRRNGQVPAVIYGKHEDSFSIQLDITEFKHVVHPERMRSVLVNLTFPKDDTGDMLTIIREIQRDPLHGNLLHLDFLHLHPGEKLELHVPVVLHGTPAGVKEGGVLEYLMRELHIKCLPKDIPEQLDVDVSHLNIGQSVHASDVTFEAGEILNNPGTGVATVLGTRALAAAGMLEEEAAAAAAEEAAEGAPVPEGE